MQQVPKYWTKDQEPRGTGSGREAFVKIREAAAMELGVARDLDAGGRSKKSKNLVLSEMVCFEVPP